jgi:hypothetical protein
MSSTVRFPISLNPILSQPGLSVELAEPDSASLRAFFGGASKCGVIFVR